MKPFKLWVETQYNFSDMTSEKLLLKDWDVYRKLVAFAYKDAPDFDEGVIHHWESLNDSNHKLFKRLLSKVNIILVSADDINENKIINLLNKEYLIQKVNGDPYPTQEIMKDDYIKTGSLKINIDYSDHPIFSVEDNIIFRCVHDFIVHILGDYKFGDKGEIASYNLHAKLAPPLSIPALFTEVVGQACYAVEFGEFPIQKIAVLNGFDYNNVGEVSGYLIKNKQLF